LQRVTGIGGIFFKARNPKALAAWYRDFLGIPLQDWGGAVFVEAGTTVWNVFPESSDYFGHTQRYMVNYRVADLHGLLTTLRSEGCRVEDKVEESELGKFGWVIDPEGNRVELWQPPA
jgi:predicted enzyme related to lactoylglutathione lyase